jgi:hypothetical protein
MDALPYAQLAKAAYSDIPTIGAEDSAARAVVTTMPDGTAVAFPGTNNIACWLADLDAEVTDIVGLGGVHAGFWRAFQSISPALMQRAPQTTVGHSEGAALAIIYAAALCLAGKPPMAVYGFEPPRVSVDGTIGALLAEHGVKVYLYRNGEDLVPLVPRLLHVWQHPAELIAIGTPSEPLPNVTDHMIDNVIAALG